LTTQEKFPVQFLRLSVLGTVFLITVIVCLGMAYWKERRGNSDAAEEIEMLRFI
jgi:cbb3-type cytochrome oxidase subunit 3